MRTMLRRHYWLLLVMASLALDMASQSMSYRGTRKLTLEEFMSPRSTLLTGTAGLPSARGQYVITFPSPNECVRIPPIDASSRAEALYRAVSRGGFALAPHHGGGLIIWTIEEWEEAELDVEKYAPGFKARRDHDCAEKEKR